MNGAIGSATFGQLEGTILQEIRDISAQIQSLERQKKTLEDILVRTRERSDLVKRTDVTRKNSINRILVEGSILQSLQNAKRPVQSKNLFITARLMVPNLPESTFRSHLFRMKRRELIETVGSSAWQLKTTKAA